MEPLIFALIIMAVSAFFSNKKKGEERSSSGGSGEKKQSPSGRAQGGFKRMEDYAKEVYGEFQTQMNPETDKKTQATKAAKEVAERYTKSRPGREREVAAPAIERVERASGRLSAHQKPASVIRKEPEPAKNLFPLTQNDAQRGIILAEVFMPPKSKRKK
ncbi:hypothetical protein [Metaplanococcus flavidus]|uniref:Uncharacterized protein n=1 Tax=Metaplanococcus flavidus TaxID=569883 RepID=A0ABW3L844_9BACL